MWQKCQICVPSPISAPSSTYDDSCTRTFELTVIGGSPTPSAGAEIDLSRGPRQANRRLAAELPVDRLENPHDLQAIVAVALRLEVVEHAADEMLALDGQRLALRDARDHNVAVANGDRRH